MGARSSNGAIGRHAKDARNRKQDTGIVESQRRKYEAAMDIMHRLRALRLAKEASDKVAMAASADSAPAKRSRTQKGGARS
jgi:hypothetical protein